MAISSSRYVSIKSAVVTSIRSSIRGGDTPVNPYPNSWINPDGSINCNGIVYCDQPIPCGE